MKVKVLKKVSVAGVSYQPGDQANVSERQAQDMINRGAAKKSYTFRVKPEAEDAPTPESDQDTD